MNTSILGLLHDDGIYNVLAKALNEGEGYRIISLPSAPLQAKYPFVYPYILSWIWWLNPTFPDNIFLLKAVNSVLLFVILLFSYGLCCKDAENQETDAFIYVALVGGNSTVFSCLKDTIGEPLFLALTLLALLLYGYRDQPLSTRTRVVFFTGIVALAYLTRTAAAPLIVAGVLHLLITRRYQDLLLYLSLLVVFVLPWLLWQFNVATDTPRNPFLDYYISYDHSSLAFVLAWSRPSLACHIIWGNLRYLIESLDRALLLSALPELRFVIYPLLIWGFCISFRQRTVFFYSFILLYLLLILAWPWHPGRFSLPLIPLVLLFLLRGVQAAADVAAAKAAFVGSKRIVAVVARLPLIALVALNLIWLLIVLRLDPHEIITQTLSGQQIKYHWDGFMETFAWIREHTYETDVLATAYDPMYYLYTGRKGIRPWLYKPETYFYPYGQTVPDVGSVEETKKGLIAFHARYLIIDPYYGFAQGQAIVKLLDELLHSYPTPPQLVFSSTDGLHQVYELPVAEDRHD